MYIEAFHILKYALKFQTQAEIRIENLNSFKYFQSTDFHKLNSLAITNS